MPMLEDMMMKQGMQGQQAPQGAPQGMNQGSNNFGQQAPPPMPMPPAPPAQGFADGMDPELLKAIMMMMQATQGQSPMGGPQQGMPYQDPYNAPSDFRGMSPVPQGAMSPMDTGPRTQGMGSTAGMPGSERSRR